MLQVEKTVKRLPGKVHSRRKSDQEMLARGHGPYDGSLQVTCQAIAELRPGTRQQRCPRVSEPAEKQIRTSQITEDTNIFDD
jgi:hypothetical protein